MFLLNISVTGKIFLFIIPVISVHNSKRPKASLSHLLPSILIDSATRLSKMVFIT